MSISSIPNLSHRPSITINPKARLSRTFSRASIFSTTSILQDNLRLLKSMHQGTAETIHEPIKNGIHVEFKLSTLNDQREQKRSFLKKFSFLFKVLFISSSCFI